MSDEVNRRMADVAITSQIDSSQAATGWHDASTLEHRGSGSSGSVDTALRTHDVRRFLGDYELLERLGAGGMGIVYRARQRSADRIVALKLVRPERLDELSADKRHEWLTRFRAEAQATARLQHENIVTVFEVGEVDGISFYSMRLVAGISLADVVREGPLECRPAAHMMESVARAVDYAHQSGILHRDLKPRNIMIEASPRPERDISTVRETDVGIPGDSTPNLRAFLVGARPYVTDFGLAKWLDTDATGLTHTGQVMGTPDYMSPEQARDAARCTPASDVYSLGATLYELLTGRPPFRAATWMETLRQVLESEAVAPRQLNPAVDRDLQTITLKCLAKEPARRYRSAGELAEDLRRYQAGEPILARPVGSVERLVVVQAESRGALAIVTVLLAVVVLTCAVVVIAGQKRTLATTNAKLNVAINAEITASNDANRRRADAERAHDQEAEARIQADAVAGYLESIFTSPDPARDGRKVLMADALGRAVKDLAANTKIKPLTKAKLLNTVGESYVGLGLYPEAIAILEDARKLIEQHETPDGPLAMELMNDLGSAYVMARQYDKALPLFERALVLFQRKFPPDHADTMTLMNNLALTYHFLQRLEQAATLQLQTLELKRKVLGPRHPETLQSLHNYAALFKELKQFDRAQPLYREARDVRSEVLGPEHPATLLSALGLADVFSGVEDHEQALSLYLQTLKSMEEVFGPDHPNTLSCLGRIAITNRDLNRLQDALPVYEDLVTRKHRKLGEKHPSTLSSENSLAVAYRDANQTDKALPLVEKTMRMRRETLGAEHVDTLLSMNNLAACLLDLRRFAEVEQLCRELLELRGRITPSDWMFFRTQLQLGTALVEQQKLDEAESMLTGAYQKLKQAEATVTVHYRNDVPEAARQLVKLYEIRHQPDKAEEWRKLLSNDEPNGKKSE